MCGYLGECVGVWIGDRFKVDNQTSILSTTLGHAASLGLQHGYSLCPLCFELGLHATITCL